MSQIVQKSQTNHGRYLKSARRWKEKEGDKGTSRWVECCCSWGLTLTWACLFCFPALWRHSGYWRNYLRCCNKEWSMTLFWCSLCICEDSETCTVVASGIFCAYLLIFDFSNFSLQRGKGIFMKSFRNKYILQDENPVWYWWHLLMLGSCLEIQWVHLEAHLSPFPCCPDSAQSYSTLSFLYPGHSPNLPLDKL